ncbi:MAG: hypothetical protein NZL98_06880 [Anaerolineales bacterium]|nr:hypothetical protein [Anaerolineales bacterium]MDW8226262.1 hypothetical protein [Anaerolineales bacterium]
MSNEPTSTVRPRFLLLLGWTRHSLFLLSGFLLTIGLIVYIWWPLAEDVLSAIDWSGPWWLYFDWLLVGIFLFMSLTIVAHADLRTDGWLILVGTFGGLVIESWGTQTNLWTYYTDERPPLWIIPAWPIASLSIDRITRLLLWVTRKVAPSEQRLPGMFEFLYWCIFLSFLALMLVFVSPTFDKPYTLLATFLVVFLILTPNDKRTSVLTFLAGAGLGYFLELWGTTRQCWTYYTHQTPPLFAVLAHGMAAVAFWRANVALQAVLVRMRLLRSA